MLLRWLLLLWLLLLLFAAVCSAQLRASDGDQVDDDIVFLARHAIAELVREKLRRRCMFVSANAPVLRVGCDVESGLNEPDGGFT